MTSTIDRVAVLTGGSGGIGRASARRLAADGTAVVVHHNGNRQRAADTVAAITDAGGRAVAFGCDIAEERTATALFVTAEQEFGGVDVLVYTAGIMSLAPIAELALEVLDRLPPGNARGVYFV